MHIGVPEEIGTGISPANSMSIHHLPAVADAAVDSAESRRKTERLAVLIAMFGHLDNHGEGGIVSPAGHIFLGAGSRQSKSRTYNNTLDNNALVVVIETTSATGNTHYIGCAAATLTNGAWWSTCRHAVSAPTSTAPRSCPSARQRQ